MMRTSFASTSTRSASALPPIGPSTVAATSGSEPWRECGTRRRSTERPKSTPCYAGISSCVVTRATSLTGSHERLEAREPDGGKPVKAASRRSRARPARVLTGLQSSGNGSLQAIMARRGRRGARIDDLVQPCAKLQAASQNRTSLQQADPIGFFHSPTGAHLALFILPLPGRRSAPRRPCAIPRQTTIQQKLRSTISAAGFAQVHCSRHAESLAIARA
jgi:hypothetical protein